MIFISSICRVTTILELARMVAAGWLPLSTLSGSSGIWTGERRLLFSTDASWRAVEIASTEDCFASGGCDELWGYLGGIALRLGDDGSGGLVGLR